MPVDLGYTRTKVIKIALPFYISQYHLFVAGTSVRLSILVKYLIGYDLKFFYTNLSLQENKTLTSFSLALFQVIHP